MLKQINKEQYLQVVGLLTLAADHNEKLKDIEKALRSVLQVSQSDDKSGIGSPEHISDAVYGDYTADYLLFDRLGLTQSAPATEVTIDLDAFLDELPLKTRARKCIKDNVDSPWQLLKMTAREMTKWKYCGATTVANIAWCLDMAGIAHHMRDDWPIDVDTEYQHSFARSAGGGRD